MRGFVQWGLALGGTTVGQAYVAAEIAAGGADAPRWFYLASGALALMVSAGVNLMTAAISSGTNSGVVAQPAERPSRKVHQRHGWY